MGMFDRVYVLCPKCGTGIEFQSKAGDCLLIAYTLYDAPPEILGDLSRDTDTKDCPKCKSSIGIKVVMMAQAYIKYKDDNEAWENGE